MNRSKGISFTKHYSIWNYQLACKKNSEWASRADKKIEDITKPALISTILLKDLRLKKITYVLRVNTKQSTALLYEFLCIAICTLKAKIL